MTSKIKFLLIFLILFFGCFDQIKNPVLPRWEISYTIPIVNRTEIVIDRVKGTKGIFVDSSTHHLILKYDSTEIKTIPLDKLFSDKIDFEDEFTIKPQRVDTISFESFIADDSVALEELRLYKGTFEYEVINYLDKKVNLNFTMPGFTKTTSFSTDTLKFTATVSAFGNTKNKVDLKDYFYKNTTNPFGGNNNGFYLKGFAKVDNGYSGDSIIIKVKMKDLGFNYLKGKIKPLEENIKSKSSYIDINKDLKDVLPKIEIYGAKIILSPQVSSNNLEIRLKDFKIIGSFKSGAPPKLLKINNSTVLDTIISLSVPKIEFNIDDFAINEFLNPVVPDTITYSGNLILNPNYKSIEINFPDTIKYSIKQNLYSIFRIQNATKTDTSEFKLENKIKNELDNLLNAKLKLSIENGLPMGFNLVGYFLDSLDNKLFYFTRQIGSGSAADTTFTVLPAPIDNNGVVFTSSKNERTLLFSKDDIQKLKKANRSVLYVDVSTSNGKKVYLRSKDKIKFKAVLKINLLVSE